MVAHLAPGSAWTLDEEKQHPWVKSACWFSSIGFFQAIKRADPCDRLRISLHTLEVKLNFLLSHAIQIIHRTNRIPASTPMSGMTCRLVRAYFIFQRTIFRAIQSTSCSMKPRTTMYM